MFFSCVLRSTLLFFIYSNTCLTHRTPFCSVFHTWLVAGACYGWPILFSGDFSGRPMLAPWFSPINNKRALGPSQPSARLTRLYLEIVWHWWLILVAIMIMIIILVMWNMHCKLCMKCMAKSQRKERWNEARKSEQGNKNKTSTSHDWKN